jgi:hypothetical protein
MITDGWGRDLLPPDNAPDNQAGAQGGTAEQADAAQEVQLPEYRGWSQGMRNPGNNGGSGAISQRGGCLGARPRTRGMTPSRGVPPTRGGPARGGGPGRPSREARDPPALQVRIGAARPQNMRGARPRLKVVPPPRRKPAPSPPPAPGRGPWGWLGSIRGHQGQRGGSRRRPPRRPPSPDPGRA